MVRNSTTAPPGEEGGAGYVTLQEKRERDIKDMITQQKEEKYVDISTFRVKKIDPCSVASGSGTPPSGVPPKEQKQEE